jgi:hypothetical protein
LACKHFCWKFTANQKPKTKIKLEKASKKLDISAEDIIGSIKTGKSLSEDTIYLLKETNKDNKIKNFKLFINLTEELSGVLRPELFKIFKNSTQANNKDSNNLKLFSDPEPTLHITQSSFVIESNIECVVTDFKQKLIELIQNPRLYFFEKSGKDIEKFNSEEIHQTIESLSGVKIKQITKVKEAGVEFGG